ncbi:MAG TPA: FliA/WhiG family RNA polymerase sigma factor [Candidatus Methylomirabilis sp.]|nr:FliA/WhiG family RNA polymerase sigma factor [Candidatus Methylomirabilis sp.]
MASVETNTSKISAKSNASTSPTQNRRRTLTPEERLQLLIENLSEVRHIARRIHVRLPHNVPFDDLVHEGVLGLIGAVERYDPTKNVHLRAYARFRIRGAILDSLRALDWGPRQLRRQARRIEQASCELIFKLGRTPSEPDIATHLGVPLKELQQILKELDGLRVEALVALPERVSKQEVFAARSNCARDDPFDVCVRAETTRALRAAMETLAEKERQALTLYYFEERTMREIGTVLSVQESRVSQIIGAALNRLRVRLQEG